LNRLDTKLDRKHVNGCNYCSLQTDCSSRLEFATLLSHYGIIKSQLKKFLYHLIWLVITDTTQGLVGVHMKLWHYVTSWTKYVKYKINNYIYDYDDHHAVSCFWIWHC